jgi:hypothetical protein
MMRCKEDEGRERRGTDTQGEREGGSEREKGGQ